MKNSEPLFSKLSIDFFGLDTETVKGYCRLLCLSDGRVFRIHNLQDVMEFFFSFNRVRKAQFLAWNADFDIQALIKYFPKEALNSLMKGIEVIYSVEKSSMSFQYIKGKFLQFDGNYIFDACQYYGTSLLEASKKYLPEEDWKLDVDASKISEENIYTEEVIQYCTRDALAALKLFTRFHAALPESLHRVKPISNAFYSWNYFRSELRRNRPRPEVNKFFRNAYHGGRFEIYERGYFKNLYVYDINSAYPYEISKLRSLETTHYLQLPSYVHEASYSLYNVKVDLTDKFVSPLLVQDKGLCIYPTGHFEGWITKGEYERIQDHDPEIIHGFHIYAGRDTPFKEKVEELYEQKKRSGFPLPFKIILNSLYGKTAQATPKFIRPEECSEPTDAIDFVDSDGISYVKFEDISKSNFIYASEITAETRLRLYDLVKRYPDKILMVQTDSVISKGPLELPLSAKIGDWKLEKWDEAYLIGSGVYFFLSGGVWHLKFRGFNFQAGKVEACLEAVLKAKSPRVTFQVKKRYSIQEAARLHDEELGNQILEVARVLNINFDRKRIWESTWKSGTEIKRKRIRSLAVFAQKGLTS